MAQDEREAFLFRKIYKLFEAYFTQMLEKGSIV